MDKYHDEGYPVFESRGERREKKRKKKVNGMRVSGRSLLTVLRVIKKKADQADMDRGRDGNATEL